MRWCTTELFTIICNKNNFVIVAPFTGTHLMNILINLSSMYDTHFVKSNSVYYFATLKGLQTDVIGSVSSLIVCSLTRRYEALIEKE